MKWTTKELIDVIDNNGGLDMGYIRWNANKQNKSIYNYVYEYVKNYYECSNYIARKVTDYYVYNISYYKI